VACGWGKREIEEGEERSDIITSDVVSDEEGEEKE
jgi:hypothetical protein